ncbi:polymorphic toxin-type HINT domain-containing protein [Streptomyces syringium]|uniref:polymorphic toxin-type HINT domain-containing protein n=1 Tax=Streptomyces syringium TaxID=76729 RepID=UPI0033B6CBEA
MVGLLGPTPAIADGATGSDQSGLPILPPLRGQVVELWKAGGPGVKAAAEVALTGSDEDVAHFLDQVDKKTVQDNQVAAAQMSSVGGRALQEAARKALEGSPAELKAFLKDGWKAPLEQDDRVRVAQIINTGGNGVQKAGRAALNGTAEDVRAFLEKGRYAQRDQDERVQVAQILSVGGTEIQTAGRIALEGSPDDVREFLEVGQYVARARDQEQTTVAQLAELAREAGRQAAAQTEAAKDASARAVTASKLAKAAAKKAAAEASAARDDAQEAAGAAGRAASAASQAAAAAQQAIDAARAANNSARIAANAAAQAASAAAGAAQAASRARSSAADAATDAGNASAARKAAEDARTAAKGARLAADAADQASIAASAAGDAAQAASSAGANAGEAADAAEEASGYADQADGFSVEAREAAAAARRQANEATRAANAAEYLARKAATAAGEARDAARSAAEHAEAAAKAADESAEHAGEAAKAADKSTAHAKAAKEAANFASGAVAKAKATYDLARQVETAELLTRTNEGIEEAKDLKAVNDKSQAERTRATQKTKELDAEAQRLASEAATPGADAKSITDKGRKLALLAMKVRGPWSRAAAEAALGGSDADLTHYIRTAWKEAAQQDDRTLVERLAEESSLEPVRDAAEEALKGDTAQITAFLNSGQYEAGAKDFRVHIAQIMSTGGRGVQEAGRAALDSGSMDKIREFITTGQYAARTQDEKVRAAQLFDSGGPELKAEARIALEGPPQLLHVFIQSGQYKAQRKDLLANTHKARVQQLIAEAARTAATAQMNAAEAGKVAAIARKAAAEAKEYARQAQASANDAKNSAAQAAQSAKEAEASAARAAESARTARAAEADAHQAAEDAAMSAADASVSAELAHVSASSAWASANEARASATAAGKDANAATKAANETFAIAVKKLKEETEAKRKAALEAKRRAQNTPGGIARARYRCQILGCEAYENPARWCQHREVLCDIFSKGPAIEAAAKGLWNAEKNLLLIGQIQGCAKHFEPGPCVQLVQDLAFNQKLRALSTAYDELRRLNWGSGCQQCFLAGTKVLKGNGSTQNIEDVKKGDEVLATDPVRGKTAPRKVTRLIVTEDDKHFNELTIATRNGPKKLTATYEHPFWSPSENRWLKASELKPGTSLLSNDKTAVRVEANRSYDQHARTYNLTVEDLHTYYVIAGTTPILVHNSDCKRMVLGIGEHSEKLAKELEGYTFNDPKYRKVIGQVNGIPYAEWMAEVEGVLRNNGKIAISLRGFKGKTPEEQFLNAYKAGGQPGWAATQWEMHQVGKHAYLGNLDWKHVDFYDGNGTKVRFDEPDWQELRKGTKE